MPQSDPNQIRHHVRENLSKVSSCCAGSSSCCGGSSEDDIISISANLGYSEQDLSVVPQGANLGLGCGNPQAIAGLKPGETVLDLGCGGGFDCFLAARAVGEQGYVIGVDMTPEMLAKARQNLAKTTFKHVDFRLGEIENLPVADGIVDVIISNCVINLSPEKYKVFREAFRVLKCRGRLAISDIVRTADLPPELQADLKLYSGCVSGASSISELTEMLSQAGFQKIRITPKDESKGFIRDWFPGSKAEDFVQSAAIEAVKP